jgi:CHASE1-domain containing sensor protein
MPNLNIQAKKQSFVLRLRAWLFNRPIAWIVLFFSLLATFLIWKNAEEKLSLAQQVRLESRAIDVSEAIVNRMHTYEQVLQGGVGLFSSIENVSRSEFSTYIGSLDIEEQYPGIQGIGYAVQIPAAELDDHLKKMVLHQFHCEFSMAPAKSSFTNKLLGTV